MSAMPSVFVSHGGPNVVIEPSEAHDFLKSLGSLVPKPKAIVMVSAHFETDGPVVVTDPNPGMIYDFGGFQQELYEKVYPAPGEPELGMRIAQILADAGLNPRIAPERGYDHGAWNPLILACVGGALFNLTGIGLPGGTDRLLSLLAAASLPLGLLCVGAALKPEQLGGEIPALTWNSALRLLAMPLLAWGVAWALALPAMESAVLVLFFALPTAPTAYVLTRQLGGDSQLMAGIITLQTLLAAGSLVAIMMLLA